MAQKILIVEDNSDLSQLLAFYLNDAGYETSRAGNLAQGISKALAERPNLIITDLYLPDMNAVDATIGGRLGCCQNPSLYKTGMSIRKRAERDSYPSCSPLSFSLFSARCGQGLHRELPHQ